MQLQFSSWGVGGALVTISLLQCAQADLPVHCLLQDVAGEWDFRVGPAQASAFSDAAATIPACGHHLPNTVNSMLTADASKEVPLAQEQRFRVRLTEDIAEHPFRHLHVAGVANASGASSGDIGAGGYWTMVFDEGFEVRSLNGRSFFAHFHFEALKNASRAPEQGDRWKDIAKYYGRRPQGTLMPPEGDIYACHCDRLSVGWWHEHGSDGKLKSGCFWAEKVLPASAKPGDSVNFVRSRKPKSELLAKGALRGNINGRREKTAAVTLHRVTSESAYHESAGVMEVADLPVDHDMATSKEVLLLPARKPAGKREEAPPPSSTSLLHKKGSVLSMDSLRARNTSVEVAPLPQSFDWRDVVEDMAPSGVDDLSEQFNQGNCGSCYAFSGTLVLQMRFRIQLFKKHGLLYPLELSWKSATQCSPYTEGCHGGFAYLTFKYAAEVGLPLAECDRATQPSDLDQTCNWECYRNNNMIFYAKDYGQTGGFAHGADELTIMHEIHANGPVIVSFAASAIPEFIYNNGQSARKDTDVLTVIENEKVAREPSSSNSEILPWSYTTHSILAVGWGEEASPSGEILKYWVVRNSWGKDWGSQGYAKIRRGNNDAAIETSAPWVEPDMDRLPPGFLEMAKKYHKEHEAARAQDSYSSDQASVAPKAKGGRPAYCKLRPDSPDCK